MTIIRGRAISSFDNLKAGDIYIVNSCEKTEDEMLLLKDIDINAVISKNVTEKICNFCSNNNIIAMECINVEDISEYDDIEIDYGPEVIINNTKNESYQGKVLTKLCKQNGDRK